jgi:CRP-like cAMP-binding protein
MSFAAPPTPAEAATPRGFAPKSPRLSAKEVVTSAREEAKGRPPPAPPGSTLSTSARAMLALVNSDLPPRSAGFGGKVTSDGSTIVTMFPGTEVPTRLQVSPEEMEQRRIQNVVNQSEDASLELLTDILKKSAAAVDACEAQMAADAEKAKHLALEITERVPESHRPGIRPNRPRKYRRNGPNTPGGLSNMTETDEEQSEPGDGADAASAADAAKDSDDEGEGGGPSVPGRQSERRQLPLPVAQGFEELFIARAEEEEEEEEIEYDEFGNEIMTISRELGRTSDRLNRIITNVGDDASPCDFGDHPWPNVTLSDIVGMMRRVRFFRQAELQEDLMPLVAEWFEVHCYEAGTILVSEGEWAHSFHVLLEGTLEARGRVYRTPGEPAKKKLGGSGRSGSKRLETLVTDGGGRDGSVVGGAEAEVEKLQPAYTLPQPQVVGPYETLAPILLHPGASFGEAALAGPPHGPRWPHTCTVRTLERCTLLALRRATVGLELPHLCAPPAASKASRAPLSPLLRATRTHPPAAHAPPAARAARGVRAPRSTCAPAPVFAAAARPVTARQAWESEAMRMAKTYNLVNARWRHHSLRRMRLFKSMDTKMLHALERIAEYRLVPAYTPLLREGERMTHLCVCFATRPPPLLRPLCAPSRHMSVA